MSERGPAELSFRLMLDTETENQVGFQLAQRFVDRIGAIVFQNFLGNFMKFEDREMGIKQEPSKDY
jgi:hypothetical protein